MYYRIESVIELSFPELLFPNAFPFMSHFSRFLILKNLDCSSWIESLFFFTSFHYSFVFRCINEMYRKNCNMIFSFKIFSILIRKFDIPDGSGYLFKVNNGNTRAMCKICSKLPTLERPHC